MLIDCPACARSYHVNRGEIGYHGRTLICPRCQARWIVDGDGRPVEDIPATKMRGRPVSPSPSGGCLSLSRLIRRPLPVAFAGLAGLMVLIGARDPVVRAMPRMARLYALAGLPVNTRGLAFERVASSRLDPATITISGEIRNVATRRVTLPRLAYEIRDPAGMILTGWTERPPTRALNPGETLPFAAAPHDVPKDGETVSVHFVP